MQDSPGHSSPGDAQRSQTTIRLACQGCQRRKIKCDRTFPCGQCNRTGQTCVPSTRKARTRKPHKRTTDSALRDRIAKLESLVGSMNEPDAANTGDHEAPKAGVPIAVSESNVHPAVKRLIGTDFWANLTREVQALREDLEAESDDGDYDDESSPEMANGTSMHETPGYDLILCAPNSIYVMPGSLNEPAPDMQATLLEVFLENVEPPLKIFHVPTLRRMLKDGGEFLGRRLRPAVSRALKATVWFAAVNTMTDEEVTKQLGVHRETIFPQYRRMAEVAFSNADVFNTTDLVLLQAFTVYMFATRTSDQSRRYWTMVSVVIRIARAMNLHHENPAMSAYERQIRRRLWSGIWLLDAHCSADRCTEMLIRTDSFDTPGPSSVDDSEFDEHSSFVPNHTDRITDTSFKVMLSMACALTVELLAADTSRSARTWRQRLDLVHVLTNRVRTEILQHCDLSLPFHRYIYRSGCSMVAALSLRAVRPLQKHIASVPPRVDSPFVLQIAKDTLRRNNEIDALPECRKWRWIYWVHWHALAVALAGLCSIKDTPLAQEAWANVEISYERHARHVADSRHGQLWRPIEKLYNKATAFRDGHPTPPTSNSASSSPAPVLPAGAMALPLDALSSPLDALSVTAPIPKQQEQGVSGLANQQGLPASFTVNSAQPTYIEPLDGLDSGLNTNMIDQFGTLDFNNTATLSDPSMMTANSTADQLLNNLAWIDGSSFPMMPNYSGTLAESDADMGVDMATWVDWPSALGNNPASFPDLSFATEKTSG